MSTSSGITRSKVCRKCGVDKLIDAFGRDKRTPDGYARPALQFNRGRMTARNVARVERLYRSVMT